MSQTPPAESHQILGGWRLVECLHRGVETELWRVQRRNATETEQAVIKRLYPQQAQLSSARDRIHAEMRWLSRLQHTNIIRLLDFGNEGGSPFVVLQWVEGLDLARLFKNMCAAGDRLPEAAISYIAYELSQALLAVHRCTNSETGECLGLVHRDICPANVLLSTDGEIKLIDFGLALSLCQRQQQPKLEPCGHLAYLSPERARGEMASEQSDLFALGIILWELIEGRRLFAADDATQSLYQIEACVIPPVRESVSANLAELLRSLLHVDANQRFCHFNLSESEVEEGRRALAQLVRRYA